MLSCSVCQRKKKGKRWKKDNLSRGVISERNRGVISYRSPISKIVDLHALNDALGSTRLPSLDEPKDAPEFVFLLLAERTRVTCEPVEVTTPELERWIRLSAQDLRIRKRDRQWAAGIVKDFRTNLLKFLKKNDDQPYFQSCIPAFLNAGSYFELAKVHTTALFIL